MPLFFLIFGFAALIVAFILEGGSPLDLIGPTALIIVLGGTFGATGLSIPFEELKKTGKILGIAFRDRKTDMVGIIGQFEEMSLKARKEGLLALESEITREDIDPFIRKGIGLVMDGADHELIKSVLVLQIEQMSERHKAHWAVFEAAGGYAPTIGIVGTVMGLVHVLSNLSNPSVLGGSIAAAFLATMYGVSTANLIFLPIARKLKELNNKEINVKLMMTEAIISISVGDNPVIMVQKLMVFLSERDAGAFEKSRGSEY